MQSSVINLIRALIHKQLTPVQISSLFLQQLEHPVTEKKFDKFIFKSSLLQICPQTLLLIVTRYI